MKDSKMKGNLKAEKKMESAMKKMDKGGKGDKMPPKKDGKKVKSEKGCKY